MISLRKHLEAFEDELSEPAVHAFRSSLIAMAQCGRRAVPRLGQDLSQKLTDIQKSLEPRVNKEALSSAARRVEEELSVWADLALRQHNENEREIREIVGAVARAAESVSHRGEKYSSQMGELTGQFKAIADLNDLGAIRRSIVETAAALRSCVERMADESRASVQELSRQVDEYRARLRESERVSAEDPLTGLANRRAFEDELARRIAGRATFSLLMIDLDGFKAINDQHGHLAGDGLLKQFSSELKRQFAPADLVARWGGDEFGAIVHGTSENAEAQAREIRKWTFGE